MKPEFSGVKHSSFAEQLWPLESSHASYITPKLKFSPEGEILFLFIEWYNNHHLDGLMYFTYNRSEINNKRS